MNRLMILSPLVLAGVLSTANAENKSTTVKPVLDRDFLVKTTTTVHADMQYSDLVEKRSNNDKVKEFARKLLKAHKQMGDDLAKLAQDQKLAIVAGTEKETRDEIDRLSKLKGDEFDRAYLKRIVDDHERAVQMYEGQVKSGKNERMSTFAKDTLPMLQRHLKEARTLYDSVKTK
jgi:putative membrane protein